MDKLRITAIPDSRPVRMTVAFPAEIHRDLLLYARFLAEENGSDINAAKNPARLVPLMVARFIERDRVFLKKRKDVATDAPARMAGKT
ncbi:DUF2274 domain-containing protein [Gluconacetobacter diazotrophicus]|uniref:DUF2274 domain-containing protein n=2 Tax=Gluconacetobacter diazotrophicus TaxID=33996 RepID=A9HR67_GLUDA|nr:DUF2274 domain-containing protein [Gluconacetobacter diazotrophicus]MBB2156555.1 DUF2274 domain-containing protein [Gluconacetobacter diazotrophicus]CAP56848.1 conserved hypothetical protein [Gluconacetobacter diazotrophicus PA1 5]